MASSSLPLTSNLNLSSPPAAVLIKLALISLEVKEVHG